MSIYKEAVQQFRTMRKPTRQEKMATYLGAASALVTLFEMRYEKRTRRGSLEPIIELSRNTTFLSEWLNAEGMINTCAKRAHKRIEQLENRMDSAPRQEFDKTLRGIESAIEALRNVREILGLRRDAIQSTAEKANMPEGVRHLIIRRLEQLNPAQVNYKVEQQLKSGLRTISEKRQERFE